MDNGNLIKKYTQERQNAKATKPIKRIAQVPPRSPIVTVVAETFKRIRTTFTLRTMDVEKVVKAVEQTNKKAC
jgi:hypothetical protein